MPGCQSGSVAHYNLWVPEARSNLGKPHFSTARAEAGPAGLQALYSTGITSSGITLDSAVPRSACRAACTPVDLGMCRACMVGMHVAALVHGRVLYLDLVRLEDAARCTAYVRSMWLTWQAAVDWILGRLLLGLRRSIELGRRRKRRPRS